MKTQSSLIESQLKAPEEAPLPSALKGNGPTLIWFTRALEAVKRRHGWDVVEVIDPSDNYAVFRSHYLFSDRGTVQGDPGDDRDGTTDVTPLTGALTSDHIAENTLDPHVSYTEPFTVHTLTRTTHEITHSSGWTMLHTFGDEDYGTADRDLCKTTIDGQTWPNFNATFPVTAPFQQRKSTRFNEYLKLGFSPSGPVRDTEIGGEFNLPSSTDFSGYTGAAETPSLSLGFGVATEASHPLDAALGWSGWMVTLDTVTVRKMQFKTNYHYTIIEAFIRNTGSRILTGPWKRIAESDGDPLAQNVIDVPEPEGGSYSEITAAFFNQPVDEAVIPIGICRFVFMGTWETFKQYFPGHTFVD